MSAVDIYHSLCALDPDSNPRERSEALAAGIAPAQAESLYPLSLEAIALPLIEHFQQTGTAHLEGEAARHEARNQTRRVNEDIRLWPKPLGKSHGAQHPSLRPYAKSVWELLDFLRDQIPRLPRTVSNQHETDTYYVFPVALWTPWWLMARREALPPEVQAQADAHMLWVGKHLLPNLALDQEFAA
jgi:hypothetical protein